jgi:hypothetical protein
MQKVNKTFTLTRKRMAELQSHTESEVLAWLYRNRPRIDWISIFVDLKKYCGFMREHLTFAVSIITYPKFMLVKQPWTPH